MITDAGPVRLSVLRRGQPMPVGVTLRNLATDGTVLISAGTLLIGAVLVETIRFLTSEQDARWWYLMIFVVGLGLVVVGVRQRHRARRQMSVAVAISALDPRRGPRGALVVEKSEAFASASCPLALSVAANLDGDTVADAPVVERLAEYTMAALAVAERITPHATRVNLIPTLALHQAFWLGACLGHSHDREIGIYQMRQHDGTSPYFLATTLRAIHSEMPAKPPLVVGQPIPVEGVDSTRTALAVDIMAKGPLFMDPVIAACRAAGIGRIIQVRNPVRDLVQDKAVFDGAVAQVCQAWRDADLPAGSRTGRHAIFLNGPVSIAIALGARLAGAQPGAWTAYTLNPDGGTCEAFPPQPE